MTGFPDPSRPQRPDLRSLAYHCCEEMIVTCALRPGQRLNIAALQAATGFGRTPIHGAVSQLAADTLVLVRPRHGLQVAPIDLARERDLLLLRREVERFVLRLAAERADAACRDRLRGLAEGLRHRAPALEIATFNRIDRQIDELIATAAGEPFLRGTLRPLHTIFRRLGWIYHTAVRPGEGLGRTVDVHLRMLDAVAEGRTGEASRSADRLFGFIDGMFDVMEESIDPALLDCRLRGEG